MPALSWSDAITCFHNHVQQNKFIKVLPGYRFVMHEHNLMPSLQPLVEYVSKLNPSIKCDAHLYMTLAVTNNEFGNHCDTADVIFWQALGSTSWRVDDGGFHDYVLNQGDCIYVPKEMFHDVKSLTPRVGVSIGLEYDSRKY